MGYMGIVGNYGMLDWPALTSIRSIIEKETNAFDSSNCLVAIYQQMNCLCRFQVPPAMMVKCLNCSICSKGQVPDLSVQINYISIIKYLHIYDLWTPIVWRIKSTLYSTVLWVLQLQSDHRMSYLLSITRYGGLLQIFMLPKLLKRKVWSNNIILPFLTPLKGMFGVILLVQYVYFFFIFLHFLSHTLRSWTGKSDRESG